MYHPKGTLIILFEGHFEKLYDFWHNNLRIRLDPLEKISTARA